MRKMTTLVNRLRYRLKRAQWDVRAVERLALRVVQEYPLLAEQLRYDLARRRAAALRNEMWIARQELVESARARRRMRKLGH
jgi:hypothetical protein